MPSSHGSIGSCGSTGTTTKLLEEFAQDFQTRLIRNGYLQDRKSGLTKTVPNCFTGKDAVSLLVTILQEEEELLEEERSRSSLALFPDEESSDEEEEDVSHSRTAVSPEERRMEALAMGRDIAATFQLFVHATKDPKTSTGVLGETTVTEAVLEDSDREYYQFHHNLPTAVKRTKAKYPSYWDKMRFLEEHLEVQDRRHLLRVFPNCFVASEAIDVLMDKKMVGSRGEAVHLIKKLNQKVHCCEHVTHDHDFRDAPLFFRFVPLEERMMEPVSGHTNKHNKNHNSSGSTELKKTPRRRSKSPQKRLQAMGQSFSSTTSRLLRKKRVKGEKESRIRQRKGMPVVIDVEGGTGALLDDPSSLHMSGSVNTATTRGSTARGETEESVELFAAPKSNTNGRSRSKTRLPKTTTRTARSRSRGNEIRQKLNQLKQEKDDMQESSKSMQESNQSQETALSSSFVKRTILSDDSHNNNNNNNNNNSEAPSTNTTTTKNTTERKSRSARRTTDRKGQGRSNRRSRSRGDEIRRKLEELRDEKCRNA